MDWEPFVKSQICLLINSHECALKDIQRYSKYIEHMISFCVMRF